MFSLKHFNFTMDPTSDSPFVGVMPKNVAHLPSKTLLVQSLGLHPLSTSIEVLHFVGLLCILQLGDEIYVSLISTSPPKLSPNHDQP